MKPLSATMWMMLNYLTANGHGSAIASRSDQTYCALERRGLVRFERSGSKYGRSRWLITDQGRDEVSKPNHPTSPMGATEDER